MRFWVYSCVSVSSSVFSSVSVGFGVPVNSVFDLIMKIVLMIDNATVGTVASSAPSVKP